MKGKKKRLIAAIAVIGALAAGGAAYTASNTIPDSVAGFGSDTISGATASNIHYVLSADGTTITEVDLTLTGDYHSNTVQVGFNGGALTTCPAGTYDGSTSTTVDCTGFTQSTAGATALDVSVNQ